LGISQGRVGYFLNKRVFLVKFILLDFIEFVLVETNQLVSSNPNVIFMRETCGQRSGMAAGSKHRALAF